MKQIKQMLVFLLIGQGGISAQQLPNSGFEDWDEYQVQDSAYAEPLHWFTLNTLVQYGYPESSLLTTDAYSGEHAVKLQSTASPWQGSPDVPGLLLTGHILDALSQPDLERNFIPYPYRPSSINFYYKSWPMAGDSVMMSAVFTRWDTVNAMRDTLGIANWQWGNTTVVYTQVVVPVTWLTSAVPDSLSLIFSSSRGQFAVYPGSTLYLDELYMAMPVSGVNQDASPPVISVFPVPASDYIQVESDRHAGCITIYSITGQTMLTERAEGNSFRLNLSGIPAGIYLAGIEYADRSRVFQKIVIKR